MSAFRHVTTLALWVGLLASALVSLKRAAAGDALPDGAVARMGSVRFLHADRVHTLAFLPDGKELVSGTNADHFTLWDAGSGREVRRFVGNGSSVTCVAPSPDGKLVAAGDNGGTITLWNLATGKSDKQRPVGAPVQALAWSPDGKVLASSYRGSISLWEPATGRERARLKGHAQGVFSLAFSPDGKVLVSASHDKTLRVWDATTGKELRRLEGRPDSWIVLAISPDGGQVAGSCSVPLGPRTTRSLTRIWDLKTGKKVRDVPASSISAVAYSPDGKAVVTGDSDCLVRIWDASTGKEVRALRGHAGTVTALAFSPDGKTLASGGYDRRILLWDPDTGKEKRPVTGHTGRVEAVAFAPDGREVVSAGRDCTIRYWDWVTGRQLRIREGVGRQWGVGGLTYSPDGKRLLSMETHTDRAFFRLWDPASGRQLSEFGQQYLHASEVAFLPDNKTVAVAHWDGSVRLWDTATGKPIRRLAKHGNRLLALAVSSDGKTIAWAGEYSKVGLCDVASGKERPLEGAGKFKADALAFSPDGILLAGVSERGPVLLWDTSTGKLVVAWGRPPGVRAVAFSPDGSLLAVGGGRTVALWDVWAWREAGKFTGHRAAIRGLAWAPDGKVLVSASEDGTLLAWDLTGRLEGGRLRPCTLGPDGLKKQWGDLADPDASKARRALWSLAACAEVVPFLKKKLRQVGPVSPERLAKLIADLDSDTFRVRQDATRELAALGEVAGPALRKARASGPSLEVRRRAEGLLRSLGGDGRPTGDALRTMRAVSVLEHTGSPAARRVLKSLAKGEPRASLTRQAKSALKRLSR